MPEDQLRSHLVRLREDAAVALKMKGHGNPNLAEARSLGLATNKQKGTATRDRVMPSIVALQAKGVTTYEALAEGLNAMGLLTPRGGKWFKSSVRRVMEIKS
jgi:hypothetical protein